MLHHCVHALLTKCLCRSVYALHGPVPGCLYGTQQARLPAVLPSLEHSLCSAPVDWCRPEAPIGWPDGVASPEASVAAFSRLREPDAGWVLRRKEDGHSAELDPSTEQEVGACGPGSACEGRGSEAQSEEEEQPLPRLKMPRGSCLKCNVNARGRPQGPVGRLCCVSTSCCPWDNFISRNRLV